VSDDTHAAPAGHAADCRRCIKRNTRPLAQNVAISSGNILVRLRHRNKPHPPHRRTPPFFYDSFASTKPFDLIFSAHLTLPAHRGSGIV
jgi:hypothetical protein